MFFFRFLIKSLHLNVWFIIFLFLILLFILYFPQFWFLIPLPTFLRQLLFKEHLLNIIISFLILLFKLRPIQLFLIVNVLKLFLLLFHQHRFFWFQIILFLFLLFRVYLVQPPNQDILLISLCSIIKVIQHFSLPYQNLFWFFWLRRWLFLR